MGRIHAGLLFPVPGVQYKHADHINCHNRVWMLGLQQNILSEIIAFHVSIPLCVL